MSVRCVAVTLLCSQRLLGCGKWKAVVGLPVRTDGRLLCNQNVKLVSEGSRTFADAVQLQALLRCTLNEARVLITLHPLLQKRSADAMAAHVQALTEKGLTKEQMLANPWLLLHPANVILSKLNLIAMKVGGVRDGTVPLLILPIMMILRVAKSWARDAAAGHPDRLVYLVKQLQCSEAMLGQHLHKHTPILLMDFARLQSVMELLKKHGIAAESILNDLWIFRHNLERMEARLAVLSKLAVADIRPWMLRCPENTLDKFLEKWTQRRHVLQPHRDVAGYLAERLACSAEFVRTELVERNPALLSTSPVKVKQTLDWLFEKGFTAKHVCDSPRIFEVSMDSLQTRYHQLSLCDYRPRSLHILWVEWKVFDRLLRKLKEEKKKNRKNK